MSLPSIAVVSAAGAGDLVGAALGWSAIADVDLPAFRFVSLVGSEPVAGVVQEAALAGEIADVVFNGVSQIEAGEAFSAGDVLASDGVGRAVEVSSSPANVYLAAAAALALTDAADVGDLAWALIGPRPERVGPVG